MLGIVSTQSYAGSEVNLKIHPDFFQVHAKGSFNSYQKKGDINSRRKMVILTNSKSVARMSVEFTILIFPSSIKPQLM